MIFSRPHVIGLMAASGFLRGRCTSCIIALASRFSVRCWQIPQVVVCSIPHRNFLYLNRFQIVLVLTRRRRRGEAVREDPLSTGTEPRRRGLALHAPRPCGAAERSAPRSRSRHRCYFFFFFVLRSVPFCRFTNAMCGDGFASGEVRRQGDPSGPSQVPPDSSRLRRHRQAGMSISIPSLYLCGVQRVFYALSQNALPISPPHRSGRSNRS